MINILHIISIDRKSGKTEIKITHLNEEVFRVSSTYKSNVESILSPNQKVQSHREVSPHFLQKRTLLVKLCSFCYLEVSNRPVS